MFTPQQLMQMITKGTTPEQILNNMIQSNPQMQQQISQIQNMAKNNNMNMGHFAKQVLKQQGIDEAQYMPIMNKFNNNK